LAWVRGAACPDAAAVDLALAQVAQRLQSARRVLVTGLGDATLEAIGVACDIAEALGAAVDAGSHETAQTTGPGIARSGEVTAAWEEVRDRADLVLFWFHDPALSHPRFLERFVVPGPLAASASPSPARSLQRRTIAVGEAPVLPPGPHHQHLPLAPGHCLELTRALHASLAGCSSPAEAATSLTAARTLLQEAIGAAGCVAVVTGADHDSGLEDWSVVELVRSISRTKSAFAIPLQDGLNRGGSPGANAAGAAAVCTWRYGAPGAVARADRSGGAFLPAEADACRLILRGEVDAVLAVGPLLPSVEAALAVRGAPLTLVRVDDRLAQPAPVAADIHLACASLLCGGPGTLLRADGREVCLGHPLAISTAPPMVAVLTTLLAQIRAATEGDAA
jgi:formylmethanofuran dehydrogenase subunit B